jgi:hypothetical protein
MTAKTIGDLVREFDDPPYTFQDFQREKLELEYKFLEAYEISPEDIDGYISNGTLPCHNPLVERWIDLMALKDRFSKDDPKPEKVNEPPPLPYPQWARDLLRPVIKRNPLPWKVEQDWTYEVLAANGTCVGKFQKPQQAVEMIRAAIQIDREDRRGREEVNKLYKEHGLDDLVEE